MKHSRLHGVAHNYADSLASGLSFVAPDHVIQTQVFAEAASETGFITADFLTGALNGARYKGELETAFPLFKAAFPLFCEKHKVAFSDYAAFLVRFISDKSGKRYVVTIEDRNGKRSSREYAGSFGARGTASIEPGRRRPRYLDDPLD